MSSLFTSKKNRPPKLAYLAYSFTGGVHGEGSASENTMKVARIAELIMHEYPDIFVICPHWAVDAMLDKTITWEQADWSKWRRLQGGLMSLAFLSRCDILILACPPEYKYSHGVTWEWVFTHLLNRSYRKDNPIEIVYAEDLIGEKRFKKIMEIK